MHRRLSRHVLAAISLTLVACSSAGGTDNQASSAGGSDGSSGGTGGTGSLVGGSGGAPAGGAASTGGSGIVSGGAGGGNGNGGDSCGGTLVEGKRLPASLMFVLDYSWSMCQDPASSGTITCANPASNGKWNVFTKAFSSLVDALPDDTGAGLVYFPDNVSSSAASDLCKVRKTPHVPIALLGAAGQRQAMKTLPAQMTDSSPVNQTPTAEAAAAMVDWFGTVDPKTLPGARFLVLVTDGKATCANTSAALGAALAKGKSAASPVQTFVVGVPGSAGFKKELSDAAIAGGTAPAGCSSAGPTYCHFDMTGYTDPTQLGTKLDETLEKIRGKAAITCEYVMPTANVGYVNVVWQDGNGAPMTVGYDQTCGKPGWRYDDPAAPTKIILCDDTCNAVNAAQDPKLNIQIGCPTLPVPA